MFSKWFGLAVNLFFFILTGILVYNTAAKIYSDNLKALITLSIWGCMAGVVNTAVFIRMYTMAGFFVTAAVYIHLQLYKEKKAGIKFFAEVFLVTTAGGLTHYYLVVFIFFLALFYLIYFLYKKRFQEAFCYIVTYVISAITALEFFHRCWIMFLEDIEVKKHFLRSVNPPNFWIYSNMYNYWQKR